MRSGRGAGNMPRQHEGRAQLGALAAPSMRIAAALRWAWHTKKARRRNKLAASQQAPSVPESCSCGLYTERSGFK